MAKRKPKLNFDDESPEDLCKAETGIKPLPKEDSPHFFSALVHNVTIAYSKFQSNNMALDYCEVTGDWRKKVLADKNYRKETRKIRAQKFLAEIEEVEALCKTLARAKPEAGDSFEKDNKELFAMRLKAQELRRNLLNLRQEEEQESLDKGISITFVSITQQEWKDLAITEVNKGKEMGSLEDEEAAVMGISVNGLAKQAVEAISKKDKEELVGGYRVEADGTASDW
jgi:hypothetical protein